MKRMETDDGWLLSRVEDAAEMAGRHTVRFLGFLDEREQAVVTRHFSTRRLDAVPSFWGGFAEAERRMLGVFPNDMQPDHVMFPITAVQITWKGTELTHRDFLGALLSLGLKREKVGDFVIQPQKCVAFLEDTVATFVLSNLFRVGRVGVSCAVYTGEEVHRTVHFAEISDTIASERLDCVVSALVNLSRAQAEKCIAGGLVALDFLPVMDRTCKVSSGTMLSVRGYGRFLVDAVGPPTRKGRLRLSARKYL